MSLTALLAEVLFVGHALIGAELPAMVERAAAADSVPLRTAYQTGAGPATTLAWNWDNAPHADGVDARAALLAGRIDHLVLAEAPGEALAQPGFARQWADLARTSRPGAQVWLFEGWPARSGDQNWPQRLAADWPVWQHLAADTDAKIIPAGQALAELARAIGAGHIAGLNDISEVFADDSLLNDRGQYLVTMVTHASLTGRDPRGLPRQLVRRWQSRGSVVTESMARQFQDIAWTVVQSRRLSTPPAARTTPAPDAPAITAAPVVQPMPGPSGITAPGIGLGLVEVSDWSAQLPFIDLMKSARAWTGHLPGQWGGWGHDELAAGGWLDVNGWPRAMPPEVTGLTTMILTDLPAGASHAAGRYLVTYAGRGTLQLQGRVENVDTAPGRISFDFTPGEGMVLLNLTAIDAADPIRAIRITRADHRPLLEAGQVFNPDWLARIRGAELVRFMDWMRTNNSPLEHFADRPQIADYTWTRQGPPLEIMVQLANELEADPWFTLPHRGDDALFKGYAEIVARDLAPGLRAHVEYSNEVWNHSFSQSAWAEEQARARWPGSEWDGLQFYALRAGQMADIWSRAFADDPSRLVRVLSSQTGWQGLEALILNPTRVLAEGHPAPASQFDAWAVTGYLWGGIGMPETEPHLRRWLAESLAAAETAATARGLAGAAHTTAVAEHRFDLAVQRAAEQLRDGRHTGETGDTLQGLLAKTLPYHAEVARQHGLTLMMYEGGTHVLGHGPLVDDPQITAFMAALNYAPQMGQLYRDLIDGWARLTSAPFNAYLDVQPPSKWGSWGALRHLGDDNPRWRALARGE